MLIFILQNKMSVPDLLKLLDVVYYLFIASGLIVGAYLVYRRLVLFGYDKKKIRNFIVISFLATIPASYLSSRLANIFYYPYRLWDFNFFIKKTFYTTVHTYHAAIILPIIVISILTVVYHMNYKKTADTFFLYFPLVHAIGRTGCLFVGCCWGHNITINISGRDSMFTNPVPLYAVLINIMLFLFLRWRYNRIYNLDNVKDLSGLIVGLYLGIYGISRLAFEFIRKERIVAWGLTQAQIAMIVFIVISFMILIVIYKKNYVDLRS